MARCHRPRGHRPGPAAPGALRAFLLIRRTAFTLVLCLLAGLPAHAHKPSDAYLRLELLPDGRHRGSIDLALRDLDQALGLDGDGDGLVTWGELKARHGAIEAYLLPRLRLSTERGPCRLEPGAHLVDEHTDGTYAVLRFALACPVGAAAIEVDYDLFFDLDPTHRGLLSVEQGAEITTAILSPERTRVRINAAGPSGVAVFGFIGLGVEHLLFGLDHLLFLIVLLLPAAHRRVEGRWEAVDRWRIAAIDLVKVLSAFTVAHGLSLTLAMTGVVDLPDRLVESLIALTIGLAALDNLWPWLPEQRWRIAFGFGLIHGLGFASALGPMDLPAFEFGLALFGFNIGIEVAQLAVGLPLLLVVFPIRRQLAYQRGLLPLGSVAALTLAALWFTERAFEIRIAAI